MFEPAESLHDSTSMSDALRRAPLIAVASLLAGMASWLLTPLGVWSAWLPAAVAALAVLHWGRSALPGIWLGSFLAFWILTPGAEAALGVWLALGLASTATLHAATLLFCATRWPFTIVEKHDAFRFVILAGILPALFPALLNGLFFDLLGIVSADRVLVTIARGWTSTACAGLFGAVVALHVASPSGLRRVALPLAGVTVVAFLLASLETSLLSALFPLLLCSTSAGWLLLANRPELLPAFTVAPIPETRVVRDDAELQRLKEMLQDRWRTSQQSEKAWTERVAELHRQLESHRQQAADAILQIERERDAIIADLRKQAEEAGRQSRDWQKRHQDEEQRMIHYQQLENEGRQREAVLRQQTQEALALADERQRREHEAQRQRGEIETQLAQWQQRASAAEQQLRDHEQQRAVAQRRHDEWLQRANNAERQLQDLLQQKGDLQAQHDEWQRRALGAEQHYHELERLRSEAQQRSERLQQSEAELRRLADEKQAVIARLETELRQHHESHATDRSRIEQSLMEARAEIERRQADLARFEVEIRQQRDRNTEQSAQFERQFAESQREKMQAAERVAGQIARDFANPLCTVLGTIDLLGQQWDLPEDFRQALQRVREAGQAATAKLASLQALGASAAPGQSAQRVDLSELARRARSPRPGVRVECDAGQPAWAAGSADELSRLVQHLVANGAEASSAGGVVRVSAGVDGDRSFVCVEDQGVGMDDATRRRCMEPFFTNKTDHHRGFGLAECWAIAQRHGGRLDIDSAPGRGTRATLWLARQADESHQPHRRSA